MEPALPNHQHHQHQHHQHQHHQHQHQQQQEEVESARCWTSAQGKGCLGMLPHAAVLQELQLPGCGLTELPHHLPHTLQRLVLADNRLRLLGGALAELSELRHLDLSKNLLRTIGGALQGLAALESLVLDANELGMGGADGLGAGALALPQPEMLRKLSLCGCAYKNNLPGLPAELWKLRGLEELNLNYCALETFGEEAGSGCGGDTAVGCKLPLQELPRLRRLDLVGNRLAILGATSALWHCVELRVLVLTDNNLSSIDSRAMRLRKLERLFLRFNRLGQGSLPFALPPASSLFPHLHEFDVRDNLTLFSLATVTEDATAIAHWEDRETTSNEDTRVGIAAEWAPSTRRLWYTPPSVDGTDAAGNSSVSLHRSGPPVAPPRLAPGAQPSLECQLAPYGTSVLR
jgi:hypothetical protein